VFRQLFGFLAFCREVLLSYPLLFYPGVIFGFSILLTLLPCSDTFDFERDFFSAAAQVFPVLLIAMLAELLFEAEAFRKYANEVRAEAKRTGVESADLASLEGSRWQRAVAVIATVVIGEAGALWALADDPTPFLAGVTGMALISAAGALLGPFVDRIKPGGEDGLYGWR
jgi:hypothetical protein